MSHALIKVRIPFYQFFCESTFNNGEYISSKQIRREEENLQIVGAIVNVSKIRSL